MSYKDPCITSLDQIYLQGASQELGSTLKVCSVLSKYPLFHSIYIFTRGAQTFIPLCSEASQPRSLIIINVVFAGGSGSDNRYLVLAIYYVWGPKSQTTYLLSRGKLWIFIVCQLKFNFIVFVCFVLNGCLSMYPFII